MSGIKEKIYSLSPIWMQNQMITIYGKGLAKHRYSGVYQRELQRLKARDISSLDEQKEIQNKMFLDFLRYAMTYSPFYRDFYRDVDLSLIKSVDDIHLLPILDKETLRQNMSRIYTTEKVPYGFAMTGGTTGKSLVVKSTDEDTQKRMAYLDWFKSMYGFTMGQDRHARFNGKDIIPLGQKSKIFWRDNKAVNQRIYSSFYTSEANTKYYVENLNEYQPVEMDGFCSTMYDIAKYMDDRGLKPSFTPCAIFPTSETVMPFHREMIEKVFGCKMRDQYASSEGAPFIIEFPDGYMHECMDTGVFEHIRTDRGTKLIVTSFTTHGTPLIRYDIGDNIVECDDSDTPDLKIGFPAIKAIDGRKADALYSEERGHISNANMSNVIKHLPNSIINIQFVQDRVDHILIRVVVDKDRYDKKGEKHIFEEMAIRFGDKMTYDIEYVDEIERTKGGKMRMIINKLGGKVMRRPVFEPKHILPPEYEY